MAKPKSKKQEENSALYTQEIEPVLKALKGQFPTPDADKMRAYAIGVIEADKNGDGKISGENEIASLFAAGRNVIPPTISRAMQTLCDRAAAESDPQKRAELGQTLQAGANSLEKAAHRAKLFSENIDMLADPKKRLELSKALFADAGVADLIKQFPTNGLTAKDKRDIVAHLEEAGAQQIAEMVSIFNKHPDIAAKYRQFPEFPAAGTLTPQTYCTGLTGRQPGQAL